MVRERLWNSGILNRTTDSSNHTFFVFVCKFNELQSWNTTSIWNSEHAFWKKINNYRTNQICLYHIVSHKSYHYYAIYYHIVSYIKSWLLLLQWFYKASLQENLFSSFPSPTLVKQKSRTGQRETGQNNSSVVDANSPGSHSRSMIYHSIYRIIVHV